ncbi:MAG: primosomal protein N' [Spirochaetaceae bacterium]|jgi:primosomal protein N' (replication factor Y)|nr:primosomal protein N' [Spirochaetaceae bacterium]
MSGNGKTGVPSPPGADAVPYLEIIFDIPLKNSYTYRTDEKGEAAPGKRVMVPFGRREALGYVIRGCPQPPPGLDQAKIKPVRRVVDKETIFGDADIALARWMASYYLCGPGEALAAMIPSGRRTGTYSTFSDDTDDSGTLVLSGEQQAALEGLSALSPDRSRERGSEGANIPMAYLYGITGSGKTEVFLRLAEQVIGAGKSVIYLVPEISLTHQTAEVIGRRFGTAAAALHSGMTGSERLTEWMRIRRGEVRIVAGPRSAVFAPVRDLGLIIIDEEHDGSYKSGNTPRYHARQIAMHRSAESGVLLLMGSATPSAEAWKLMAEGKIRRFNLLRRLSGGRPPEIIPVSLAKTEGALSAELKEEIHATALMGRQTILFLNRRGFAYFYHCRNCGFELSCKRCSVSLTYHKSRNRAVCHYCGYETAPPLSCPQCGSLDAGFTGFGTEFVEEEVRKTFPALRIRRADADTTARKGSLKEMLDVFKTGGIDILLGTQMVAKGLNFPGLRLVGVVFADTGLHLPDFRAAERTFSLIVQVAGRAGRYFPDGRVIVQTLRFDDPAINRACALDVEGFYRSELNQRSALNFPPYSRLIRFTLRSRKEDKAAAASSRLAAILRPLLPGDAEILGPAECPIGIQNGSYRRQILLRGKAMGAIHWSATAALEQYENGRDPGVYVETDVDPVHLL